MREVMRPFPAERPDYPRCDLAPETVPSHSIKSSLLPICDEREERRKKSFFFRQEARINNDCLKIGPQLFKVEYINDVEHERMIACKIRFV